MGAIKSITHSYTSNQYLFWYVERQEVDKIEQLLARKPELVNQDLSATFRTTALHRAATNGNLEIVSLLVEKYSADVDLLTSAGQTALIGATKRNRLEVVRYLISKDCSLKVESKSGLTALDYAILQGLYPLALELYQASGELLKPAEEYQSLGSKYKYRYVNYPLFLDSLARKIDPDNTPNFLTKAQKRLEDPVVDPRETWKAWLLRNLEFKDPPLVERSQLPEGLQPQNLKFASLRHTLTKLTMSPLSQTPHLHPVGLSEGNSDCKFHSESVNTDSLVKSNSLQIRPQTACPS